MTEVSQDVIHSLYKDQLVYHDLLSDFAGGLAERVEQCEKAFASKSWKDLSRQMHQLRGAAATYGFPPLAQVAGTLEMATLDSAAVSEPEIEAALGTLRTTCEKIQAGMDNEA